VTEAGALRGEATELLRRLVACDTSNPPGREVQAVAVVEDYLRAAGVDCERVAKDEERPNLLARVPGAHGGPALAFLGHLDVVPARREDWSVEPFAAIEREGAIWGRGTIDMKCQVAAAAVALAALRREGFRAAGDLMLILMADEEVGDAGVGAAYFVEARPDLRVDYVLGEGAGERIPTPNGPIYLLDRGIKATATATVTVRGEAADASLPDTGRSAVMELSRLLGRLRGYRAPISIPEEIEPLLGTVANGGGPEDRLAEAREAHPALDLLLGGLSGTVIRPTVVDARGPANVVPAEATMTLKCLVLPGTTKDEVERSVREALGPGDYELELDEPLGGSVSPTGTPLHDAIERFLAGADGEARLVPALGYGFSDCHFMREAYGAVAYGFIPFRHGDAVTNLTTKHGADERVLVDDLEFQVAAALSVARSIGSPS